MSETVAIRIDHESTSLHVPVSSATSTSYRWNNGSVIVVPFEAPQVPNLTTMRAMREACAGDLPRFSTIAALMADLDEGD